MIHAFIKYRRKNDYKDIRVGQRLLHCNGILRRKNEKLRATYKQLKLNVRVNTGKLQRDRGRVDTAEQQIETVRFRSTKLQRCLNAQQREVWYVKIRDLVIKTWEPEIWMRMVDIPKGADS